MHDAQFLTVGEYAARLKVKPDAVRDLIKSGQLRAINVSARPDGRPTYRIPDSEVERFEQARTAQASPKATRRRKAAGDVVEFYR